MSSVRHPVGPQPAAVYWRRRLVVLLGFVAIVVIVLLIVFGRGSGGGTSTPTPSVTPTETSVAGGGPGAACNPAVIVIEPVTDSNSYPDGQQPLISMTITNTGSAACTLDVGTAEQEYAIVSGSDPIWNSRDCQTDEAAFETVLEPNVPVSTTPFAWDRTRSTTCDGARPEVIAGGATYRLSVKLGDIESADDAPFILN